MRMRPMTLLIATAFFLVSSFTGCSGGASTIRVEETIRVSDSSQMYQSPVVVVAETISVTDSSHTLLSAVITVVEAISVIDSPTLQQAQPASSPTRITVVLNSPRAGVVWRVGTAQDIAWSTTGEGITYVGIYYSADGGKSMYTISQRESNDGIYGWKVPNTPSKAALVRVIAYNANGQTLALGDSGLFTISVQ